VVLMLRVVGGVRVGAARDLLEERTSALGDDRPA
jgi:hypothetical protein